MRTLIATLGQDRAHTDESPPFTIGTLVTVVEGVPPVAIGSLLARGYWQLEVELEDESVSTSEPA